MTKKDFFLVSSCLYKESIVADLIKNGVTSENILVFINIQNIIYDIYTLLYDLKRYIQKIQQFYNQYLGQRCFIIGNGPSLRILDLEKLENEITFASNGIYALYEKTFWRPTFYCAYDYVFCKNMMSKIEDMKMLVTGCRAAFISVIREALQYKDNEDINNLFYIVIKNKIDEATGLPLFSDDCSKEIYSSGSVTYIMLQLAMYMGFQEIYLLGMDTSFSVERYRDGRIEINKTANHNKEIEKKDKIFVKDMVKSHGYNYIADVDSLLSGYEAANNVANIRNIKIYNATRGGKLEVFERVDFDTLF